MEYNEGYYEPIHLAEKKGWVIFLNIMKLGTVDTENDRGILICKSLNVDSVGNL